MNRLPLLSCLLALVSASFLRGEEYFVSPESGDDAKAGTISEPWQSIRHALTRLRPGDTLNLREGVYFENVYVALAGTPEAPITVQAHQDEKAIIDGSWREFQENPADSWETVNGEFRSAKTYPNEREILGSFRDRFTGLQTYYHAIDLRAENEILDWEDWERRDKTDLKPFYCGPGLWYDKSTGRIHLRLDHTNLPAPVSNYQGETDPRKIPLLIAPFDSTPLKLDGARHIRIKNLTIRGAGYTTISLDQVHDAELENLTVFCGTYGIRASGTQQFRLLDSEFIGNVAPWTFRADGSKRDYPGRPHRNISRLNTHAIIEIENGRESSVYATPQNDDWEIAHCIFRDAHDGVYLGGINAHFHHNIVENMHDDGIYLSPMYLVHKLEEKDPVIRVEQNVFRGVLTAVAFGGPWPETRDQIFITRNFFDLTHPVPTGRPSAQNPEPRFSTGKLMGDHGSPPWPAMKIYHNTVVTLDPQRNAAGGAMKGMKANNQRRVFNNLFLHLARIPALPAIPADQDLQSAGNLYWSAEKNMDGKKFFARSAEKSLLADPTIDPDGKPQPDSPAIDAGVEIPAEWPDPLRGQDQGKPDVGAHPRGVDSLR